MKLMENKINNLYTLLGISIFIHYGLVIFFTILLLKEIFFTKEYKKIYKNKSLLLVEIILIFSVIMSLIYKNYYGLIAIPILFCIIVGRYYTLVINEKFKVENLKLLSTISIIPFITSLIEMLITKGRAGYWFFHNPNYLGSIMMMSSIFNLYFAMEKKEKKYYLIFILNFLTIFMSGSRSALASVIIGIFIVLFNYLEKKYFTCLLLFLLVYIIGVIFGKFPFLRMDSLVEYFWLRVDIIKMAFIIFERTDKIYLLFGHGNFFYYKFTNYVYPHAHNAIIESLLSYGIVGTFVLDIVFLKYIYGIIKNDEKNILKFGIIVGVMCHNFTDFTIFWIQTVLLFIMILSYNENKN